MALKDFKKRLEELPQDEKKTLGSAAANAPSLFTYGTQTERKPTKEKKIVPPTYGDLTNKIGINKKTLSQIQSGEANLYENEDGSVLSSNDLEQIAKDNKMSLAEVLQHEQFSGYKQAKTKVIDSNNDGIIDENDEQISKNIADKMERLKGPEFVSENTINDVSIAWNNTRIFKKSAMSIGYGGSARVAGYETQLKAEDYKTKRQQAIENAKNEEHKKELMSMTDEEFIANQNKRITKEFYGQYDGEIIKGDLERYDQEFVEEKRKEVKANLDLYTGIDKGIDESKIAAVDAMHEKFPWSKDLIKPETYTQRVETYAKGTTKIGDKTYEDGDLLPQAYWNTEEVVSMGAGAEIGFLKPWQKKLWDKEQAKYIDEFYKGLPADARENYEYYTNDVKPAIKSLQENDASQSNFFGFEGEDESNELNEQILERFMIRHGDNKGLMKALAGQQLGDESFWSDVGRAFIGKTVDINNKEDLIKELKYDVLSENRDNANTAIYDILNNSELSGEEKEKAVEKEQDKVNKSMAEMKFDAATGMLGDHFKTTKDLQRWRRSNDDSWSGVVGNNLGVFAEGMVKTGIDYTLGTANWVVQTAGNLTGANDPNSYDNFDAIDDMYNGFMNVDWIKDSDDPMYNMLDDKGNIQWSGAMVGKSIADMLPFSLAIMASARKGDMSKAAGLMQKFTNPNARRMMQTAFRITANDNYQEAQGLGLTGVKASAYGTMKSMATAIVQPIMPDVNFFGTGAGKVMWNGFTENLKKAATKNGVKTVIRNFTNNMATELGEEELELVLGDLAKYSVGLGLNNSDFLDVATQKQTVLGTVLLSGSMGSVGAVNDYKATRNKTYQVYREKGIEIVKDIKSDLDAVNEQIGKFQGARLNKEQAAKLNQLQKDKGALEKTMQYGQDVIRAVNLSPDHVSGDQMELMVKKQDLMRKKKGLDKAYHGDIDSEIKAIDNQIADSDITKGKEQLADKIKKGTENIIKRLDGVDMQDGNTDDVKNIIKEENKKINDYNKKRSKGEPKMDTYPEDAAHDQGFILQRADGTQSIVINNDVSKKDNAITPRSHELMHAVVLQTMKNNPDAIVGLGSALAKEINNINPADVAPGSRLATRLEQYKDQTQEVRAEELLSLFSDATMEGAIKYEDGLFTKLGDVFRSVTNAAGVKTHFNSGRDVYNFVKDFNTNVKAGKLGKGMQKMFEEGATIGSDIDRKAGQKADPLKRSIRDDINNTLVDTIKSDETSSRDKGQAIKSLIENNPIIYKALGFNVAKGTVTQAEIDSAITAELLGAEGGQGIINTFNPKTSKFSTYLQNIFSRRKQKIYEMAGLDMEGSVTGSLQAEQAREVADTADTTGQDIDKKEPSRRDKVTKKMLSKEFNFDKYDTALEEAMLAKDFVIPTDYKSAVDHDPTLVAELFGVDPDQYTDPKKSLKKQDMINARAFIKRNPELLHGLMAKNLTGEGKATGVRNILLNAFYTKADKKQDAKFGKSKQGSFEQTKKPFNQKEFLGAFGMGADQKMMKVGNQTQQSGMVKALMNEVGKAMTNQAIRKNAGDIKNKRERLQKLRDGTSRILFARKENSIDANAEGGVSALNDLVTQHDMTPLDPNNLNHRTEMKKFFAETWSKYFPVDNLSETLGNSTKLEDNVEKGYFMSAAERDAIVKKEKENNPKGEIDGLTKDQVKLLQRTMAGKTGWFGREGNKNFMKKGADARAGMKIFVNQMAKMLEENQTKLPHVAATFLTQSKATSHLARAISIPSGTTTEWNKTPKKLRVKEHTLQAKIIGPLLINIAFKYDAKQRANAIKWLQENLFQLGLTNKSDDKLTAAGFKSEQTPEFMEKFNKALKSGNFDNVPSPLIRMVHPDVSSQRGGIDLGKQVFIDTKTGIKTTLDKFFNVDVKGPTTVDIRQKQSELAHAQLLPAEIEKDGKMVPNPDHMTAAEARGYMDEYVKLSKSIKQASNSNLKNFKSLLTPDMTIKKQIETLRDMDKALELARDPNAPEKGGSFFDFDQTLANTLETVQVTMPNGKPFSLSAAEFAKQASSLKAQDADFNFDAFKKVKGATKGPLFDLAQQIEGKYGSDNIFIVTARPQAAADPIHKMLKEAGLNIKPENIFGLEDGSPQSKVRVIIKKAAEGYNDFLFADDQIKNVNAVQNILNVVDVKSDVRQARIKMSKKMGEEFDKIIEENSGLDRNANISVAKAKQRGAKVGNWFTNFFLAPSAEDFTGLLYTMIGKGRKGEAQFKFLKEVLLNPFARGIRDLNAAKQQLSTQYDALGKTYPDVKKKLRHKSALKDYNNAHAIRVYLWNKNGIPIPGLSKTDEAGLVKHVRSNPDMMAYADKLSEITGIKEGYTTPSNEWMIGNISTDLMDVNQKIKRSDYLKEYLDNYEKIFTPERLNKLELLYGTKFTDALKDMQYRMKYGTNRSQGTDKITQKWQNWVNNSVGAIMFFNMRSAVLQTTSAVNFVNWSDNNPMKAAAALANQKQYWKDFSFIFNHPTLKQRRAGLDIDINASEIANRVANSNDKVSAALNWLLQKGFTPTRIADSFAIASGGATFYRNRVNTYVKQGLDKKTAEEKAFLDFQEISEKSQQSARPDMISQQQAGPLGRLVLAFQVTPMQYTRLMKRAVQDLVAGRGDTKTHISKIIYYGAVQNIIFNSLQSAMFALAFADDEEDDEDKMTEAQKKKTARVANNMVDSLLRGLGVQGAAVATIKNMIIKFLDQEKRGYRADHAYTLIEGLNISPPIGSKARKVYSATQSYKFNRDAIKEMGFDINSPAYEAVGNIVSGTTNVPLDRVISNINNLRAAMDKNNAAWQRVSTLLGWNRWDIGIPNRELEKVKAEIKKRKAEERKRKKSKK